MTVHSSEWTARDIARYDQALACADTQIGALITVLRNQSGDVGERQALANVASLILSGGTESSAAGLLMAALRQLAWPGAA